MAYKWSRVGAGTPALEGLSPPSPSVSLCAAWNQPPPLPARSACEAATLHWEDDRTKGNRPGGWVPDEERSRG